MAPKNWDEFRGDIRILIAETTDFPELIEFAIVTGVNLTDSVKSRLKENFKKLLTRVPASSRKFYSLELWDDAYLKKWEKKEGLID